MKKPPSTMIMQLEIDDVEGLKITGCKRQTNQTFNFSRKIRIIMNLIQALQITLPQMSHRKTHVVNQTFRDNLGG